MFLERQHELLLSVPSDVPNSSSSGPNRQCAVPSVILYNHFSCIVFNPHKRVR